MNRFEVSLSSNKHPFSGNVVEHHIFVKYKESERHFWSPELTLEIIRNYLQDDQFSHQTEPTILRGYISPNPSIWTMFVFAYVGLGIMCLITLMFGLSQLMLGQPTQVLWCSLACMVLALLTFITSQIGQRIAEQQTNCLIQFINDQLSEKDGLSTD